MFKGLKYIGIPLLLIFIIPIVYQPLHNVRHHSQKEHDCSQGICRAVKKTGAPVVQKNEHCPICEYEFTTTNLPVEFKVPFVESHFSELIAAKIQDKFLCDVIFHASPRAPPFLS